MENCEQEWNIKVFNMLRVLIIGAPWKITVRL